MGSLHRIKTLYKISDRDINSPIAIAYSRMKLGDRKAITRFARELRNFIKADLRFSRRQETAIIHVPTIIKESGIHYVAEIVASLLHCSSIELIKKRHTFNYQAASRVIRLRQTRDLFFPPKKQFFNQQCILLDDAYVTGLMIKACERLLLKNRIKVLSKYAIIGIETNKPQIESILETAILRVQGLDAVIELLNNSHNLPTNFVITFLYGLPPPERHKVKRLIRPEFKKWIGTKVRQLPKAALIAQSELKDW